MMTYFNNQAPTSLEEISDQSLCSGKLTHCDRLQTGNALLQNALSEEHQDIINRLIYNAKRGRLT
ncbi:hypothetical protein [Planktothricoides raciborskii]|uniref:Uncharacterized protein n=2 Tax=Planktothricoides raciborskii TaxID=132608 RepID=A0AAU8JA10_9CYAN|nr:hypothetical protein [Planktothricoides raciborskii]